MSGLLSRAAARLAGQRPAPLWSRTGDEPDLCPVCLRPFTERDEPVTLHGLTMHKRCSGYRGGERRGRDSNPRSA
jgi:hypothetical protein